MILRGELRLWLTFALLSFSPEICRVGLLDPSFDPGSGADDVVHALIVQPDGKVIIGGAFTNFNGIFRRGVVRLLPNGAVDASFDPGEGVGGTTSWQSRTPRVRALALQADGKLLVGGDFTMFHGVQRLRLARLNVDGLLDETFNPVIENSPGESPTDANYPVRAVYVLTVQSDGRILMGGEFNAVNGVAGIRLARLNEDGSLDRTFDTSGSMGYADVVQSITPLDDGRVVIAGTFSNSGFPDWQPDRSYPALRRLSRDGHRDAEFEKRLGQGFAVRTVLTLPNGDLLAAGQFDISAYDSTPARTHIAQLRRDGTVVRWNPLGAEGAVRVALSMSDGRLLLGGDFESMLGKHREHIARLLPDGSLDQCFGLNLRVDGSLSADPIDVQEMQLSTDGTGVFIAGNFARVDGFARAGVARLRLEQQCDGGSIRFAVPELHIRQDAGAAQITIERTASNNQQTSVVFQTKDGSAQAGIDYTSVSQTVFFAPGEIAKTIEVPVRFYQRSSGERTVQLVLRDVIGGATLGEPSAAVLQISQATGLETVLIENPDFHAELPETDYPSVVRQPDGRLLVKTCKFLEPSTFVPTLIRLNPDGTRDRTFSLGYVPESCIGPIVFQDDGKMVLWGGFTGSEGNYSAWMGRVHNDGSLDGSFRPPQFHPVPDRPNPPLTYSYVVLSSIEVLPRNMLLVAGAFRATDGPTERRGLVRLLSDGSIDPTFDPDLPVGNSVSVLLVQPDGKRVIYVSSFGDSTVKNHMIRLNADGSRDFSFEVSSTELGSKWPLLAQTDGTFIFRGSANVASTADDPLLVRVYPDGTRDFNYRPPEFRAAQAGSGWWRGAFITAALQLDDSSLLLAGQFDWVGGIPRQTFVRLFPNGELDASFRAQVPVVLKNGVQYSPLVTQILAANKETLLAEITYGALTVTDRPQFVELKEFRFATEEVPPVFQIGIAAATAFSEAKGEAIVSIFRTGNAGVPGSVRYVTVPRSAKEGQDFLPQAGLLEFAPGERHKEIHIPLVNDDLVEPDETFRVLLSDPSPGTPIEGPDSIEMQIVNDDYGVEFESAEYRVDELGRVVELRVRRTGVAAGRVTVDYMTRDVTATAGADYQAYGGTLSFYDASQTPASIVIQIRDDGLAEGNETFQVVLSNPTGGASLGETAVATVTIVDNDTPGRPGHGVDGTVSALAAQADGMVMVGGNFTTINGVGRTALARVHSDLSVDESFNAHLDSGTQIRRLAVQPDGKAIVIGAFTNIQGASRTIIARLERDGTLDRGFAPTFQPPEFFSGYYNALLVSAVAVLSNARILVGGQFTSVNGVTRVGIARLNADGSVDPSFSHGNFIGGPPSSGGYVVDMLVQPDGKIVIGGLGNTLRDIYHNTVLRLEPNGGVDTGFLGSLSRQFWEGGFVPFSVQSLAAQRNGQILVLPTANENGFGPAFVRLNPNGAEDTVFGARLPWPQYSGSSPGATAAFEGPDGALWIGGRRLLVRLRPDGSLDLDTPNPFSIGMEPRLLLSEYYSSGYGQVRTVTQESPEVTAFVLKPDGRIVIGGNFVTYGGLPVYGLADVYPDGTPYGLLRLTPPKVLDDGRVNLNLIVPVDEPFTLERSADLTNWQSLLTRTSVTNRVEVLDPDPLGDAARFYRLRRGGP